MKLAAGLLMMCGVLAACGQTRENYYQFEGSYYNHKAKGSAGRFSPEFVVEVSKVSNGLEGARQAGRYEGVRYCIDKRGTSDIRWTVGPDSDEEALTIRGDTLVLQGTCVE